MGTVPSLFQVTVTIFSRLLLDRSSYWHVVTNLITFTPVINSLFEKQIQHCCPVSALTPVEDQIITLPTYHNQNSVITHELISNKYKSITSWHKHIQTQQQQSLHFQSLPNLPNMNGTNTDTPAKSQIYNRWSNINMIKNHHKLWHKSLLSPQIISHRLVNIKYIDNVPCSLSPVLAILAHYQCNRLTKLLYVSIKYNYGKMDIINYNHGILITSKTKINPAILKMNQFDSKTEMHPTTKTKMPKMKDAMMKTKTIVMRLLIILSIYIFISICVLYIVCISLFNFNFKFIFSSCNSVCHTNTDINIYNTNIDVYYCNTNTVVAQNLCNFINVCHTNTDINIYNTNIDASFCNTNTEVLYNLSYQNRCHISLNLAQINNILTNLNKNITHKHKSGEIRIKNTYPP